jgi:hypothetical protein
MVQAGDMRRRQVVVKFRTMAKEEAKITRTRKPPGIRKQRMAQFDEYVDALVQNPAEAVVYEELEEPGQKFVLSSEPAWKTSSCGRCADAMRSGRGSATRRSNANPDR